MRPTFLGAILASLLAVPSLAQDMVGVSWTGDVYRIDSTSGAGSLIGPSGAVDINALAKRSDGKLFAAGGTNAPTTDIYEIDPVTAVATSVATVSVRSIRSMAFGPADELYATDNPISPTIGPMDLYLIDLSSGTATLVGSTGLGIQGMAWGVDTLYGWEVGLTGSGLGLGLITIDPTTAVCTDVDPSTPGSGLEVQGLAFSPAGELYGGNDELYAIELSTGATSLVGSGGYSDLRGLEFTAPTGPAIYCTAKPTSLSGCLPTIAAPSATASLTAGASSYDVTCGPLPGGNNVGILTYTTLGPLAPPVQTAFGWQCIPTGPGYFLVLPPKLTAGGTPGTCSGSYTFDFGAYLSGPNPDPALVSGAQVDMQVLYRDPQNTGTANLSNALSVTLVP